MANDELSEVAGCDLRALRSEMNAMGDVGPPLFSRAADALRAAEACKASGDLSGLRAAKATLSAVLDDVRRAQAGDALIRGALRSPTLIGALR